MGVDRTALARERASWRAVARPPCRRERHLCKFRTGAPWCDLPSCYGPWQTCYDRFVRWRRDGTWNRLLAHTQTKSDTAGEVVWEVSVDSTVARAHQHAAGARRRPSLEDEKGGSSTPKTRRSGGAEAG